MSEQYVFIPEHMYLLSKHVSRKPLPGGGMYPGKKPGLFAVPGKYDEGGWSGGEYLVPGMCWTVSSVYHLSCAKHV